VTRVFSKTLIEVRERKLIWCDSRTDSKVWMGEENRMATESLSFCAILERFQENSSLLRCFYTTFDLTIPHSCEWGILGYKIKAVTC